MKNKISVIIPTLNEEKDIVDCINSAKKISEDIVVVDSGSTDQTVNLSKKSGARVFVNKFTNFSDQRNFANSKTKHDWVFSMDADERVTDFLAKEIDSLNIKSYDAYLIPRLNIIFNKEIKNTRWFPDKHVWLYNKSKGAWTNGLHEEFVSKGKVGELTNHKLHYSHKSVTDFLKMTNNYSTIEANSFNGKYSVISHIWFPLRSFFGRYLYKKGFLDGMHGFVLSALMAWYRFMVWSKIWERQK